MASTAGLALRDPPIKLSPSYKEEDLIHVDLSNVLQVPGGGTDKRKAKIIKLTESLGSADFIELLCRLVIEFEDAAGNERLRLTNGPLLFAKFRECLGPVYLNDFDEARVLNAQTVAGFELTKTAFIAKYIPTTAAMDQLQFLRTTRKPYDITVTTAGLRLRLINRYGSKFPGQNGQPLLPNELQLKSVFFTMMMIRWQNQYLLNSGREITVRCSDPLLSFDDLVQHMQYREDDQRRQDQQQGFRQPNQDGGRQDGQYHFNDREEPQDQGGYYQYNDNQHYNENGHYDYDNEMMGQGQYQYNTFTGQGEDQPSYKRSDNGERAPNDGGRTYNGGRQAYNGRGYVGGRGSSNNGYNGNGRYDGSNGGSSYNGGRGSQGRNNGGRGFQGRGYQGRGSNGYQQGRGNFQNNGRGYQNNGGRGYYNNNHNNGGQQQYQGNQQNGGSHRNQDNHYYKQQQQQQDQHWIEFGDDDGYFDQGDY